MPYTPGGSRLGNFGKLVVSATYQLTRGVTPEEAEAAVLAIHGWATADQAKAAVYLADVGVSYASQLNTALRTEEESETPVALPELPNLGWVSVDFLVTDPDNESQSFSVRIDVAPGTTIDDAMELAFNQALEVLDDETSDTQSWGAITVNSLSMIGFFPIGG